MAGGILMVVAISAFIVVHEAGHYWAARATGMKATEFFLGFGPRLWSFRRGETEFGVKALLFGGYVRIAGMTIGERIDPADAGRAYREQPFWKKSVVVLSGVTLNLLTAYVLLFGLFWYSGAAELTTAVQRVSPEISPGVPSPAAVAGVLDGDILTAIDGVALEGWEQAVQLIMSRPGETVALEVVRDGRLRSLTVTLGSFHPQTGEAVGFLGVSPEARRVSIGPFTAAGRAATAEWAIISGALDAISRIVRPGSLLELGGVLAGQSDVPEEIRPVSPIGLVRIGSQASEVGIGNIVFILAVVNVTLALFNSVPLYPLDGGHFAVALYEKVTGRRVDHRNLVPIAAVVILFMLFLGLVAIILDIVNPLTL